jgi:hypothetical protein
MSALPPIADVGSLRWHVRFVPKGDISGGQSDVGSVPFALNRYAVRKVIAANSSPTFRIFGRAGKFGVDRCPRDP